MAKRRVINIEEHEIRGLEKLVFPALQNLQETWSLAKQEIERIQESYWTNVKAEVEILKHRQNNAVAKLPAETFLSSTFIVYRPYFRVPDKIAKDTVRLTWGAAKYQMSKPGGRGSFTKTDHIKINASQSSLMPGFYADSKFKFKTEAEWQKEFVLRTEREIHHYRILMHKLQIGARELTSLAEELNKVIDKPTQVQDPNGSPQDDQVQQDPLMAAAEALSAAFDNINAIDKVHAELLVKTDDETLESYNIDPDIKDMYVG